MQLDLFDSPAVTLTPRRPEPPSLNLRPYQAQAIESIHADFGAGKSTLLVLPTGTGKTICFAHLAKQMPHGRVMILAHREELIFQAAKKLKAVTGEKIAVEMANHWSNEGRDRARIVVSTVQTQIAGENGNGRMSRFAPNEFGLLVIDEAHHVPASSYRKVIDWYRHNPTVCVLGVTATPDRLDEKALGQMFDSVAFDYEISDAIRDGWLVPIRQSTVTVEALDLSAVKTTAGDLNQGELARVMEEEEILHRIASPTIDLAGHRKTLVFASSVAHAERLAEIFNRHSDKCARWVCAKTPKDERRQMFCDYAAGKFQVLCNVGVLTEGFDEPSVEVVAVARPTKSRALYAQMVGRGTRPLTGVVDGIAEADARRAAIANSGKSHLEVIDFVGNAGRHKLITTADILGGKYDDEVVEQAKRDMRAVDREGRPVPVDTAEALEKAKAHLHELRRRERERRREVKARAAYTVETVNPFDVFDVEPERERGWHKGRPITDKMAEMLRRNGFDPKALSYTHAQQVIGQIIDHPEKLPCTVKQAGVLRRFGYNPEEANKAQATKLIDAIVANGWRRP